MFYADTIGLDKVVAALETYTKTLGPDFEPAELLVRTAKEGKRISAM